MLNLCEQPGIAGGTVSLERVGGFGIDGAGVVLPGLFVVSNGQN